MSQDTKILTLKDAGQRLAWRFTESIKNQKPFNINKNDLDALNITLQTINAHQKKVIADNILFAKLYTVILQELAIHYKSVDVAQQQINRTLALPIDALCNDLVNKLNQIEGQRCLENQNATGAEFLEASETWDIDNVTGHLNFTISQAIHKFRQQP